AVAGGGSFSGGRSRGGRSVGGRSPGPRGGPSISSFFFWSAVRILSSLALTSFSSSAICFFWSAVRSSCSTMNGGSTRPSSKKRGGPRSPGPLSLGGGKSLSGGAGLLSGGSFLSCPPLHPGASRAPATPRTSRQPNRRLIGPSFQGVLRREAHRVASTGQGSPLNLKRP